MYHQYIIFENINFINVEDNEKLKAKVTDDEVYITELLEGKTQAEEQYLKEKQITTG